MTKEKSIKIKSKTENLKKIREFVSEFARENGYGEKAISEIMLAVDEAATNIIKHAYKYAEDKDIIVKVSFDGSQITVSLKDFGEKFDPSKAQLPNIRESLKLKKAGGLGIYLMKKLTDEVIYNVGNPEFNEIRLVKNLRKK